MLRTCWLDIWNQDVCICKNSGFPAGTVIAIGSAYVYTGHSPTSDQRVLGFTEWMMNGYIQLKTKTLRRNLLLILGCILILSLIVVVSFKLLWCLVWGRTLRRNFLSVKLFGSLLPITPVTHLSSCAHYEGNNWLRVAITSCVNICIILKVCITTAVTPMILAAKLCLRKQSEWLRLYEKWQ